MNDEERILCLAARTQHSHEAEARLVQALNGPLNWKRVWDEGERHEVLSRVGASLRKLGERALVPSPWAERFQQRYFATLLENTLMADELQSVVVSLQAAGVEAMAVKRVVLAHTLYD